MVKIAVLDDWQDVARKSADWSALAAPAELVFFADAFGTEDEAAAALADFDILLTMRERTAFPATIIRRLPKLRMISITGASVATLDLAACARQGIVVCNTAGGAHAAPYATAELSLGLMIAAARSIPAADASIRAGGFQHGVPIGVSLAGKSTWGPDGPLRAGARHECRGVESKSDRRQGAAGRRPPRRQIRAHGRVRRHLDPYGPVAAKPRHHRGR
jgi:hypothetical protein